MSLETLSNNASNVIIGLGGKVHRVEDDKILYKMVNKKISENVFISTTKDVENNVVKVDISLMSKNPIGFSKIKDKKTFDLPLTSSLDYVRTAINSNIISLFKDNNIARKPPAPRKRKRKRSF